MATQGQLRAEQAGQRLDQHGLAVLTCAMNQDEELRPGAADQSVDPVMLSVARRQGGHSDALAQLAGRRMVYLPEVNSRGRWDEALIKHLTGGEPIKSVGATRTAQQARRAGLRLGEYRVVAELSQFGLELTVTPYDGHSDPVIVKAPAKLIINIPDGE